MSPENDLVRFLGNMSTEGFGEETLRTWHCNIDCTREDGCSQTKLTCQEHVPERTVDQIIDVLVPLPISDIEVQVPLPILEKTVAEMKLAPHEQAQAVEFLQPHFINKVVDDRVTIHGQVAQFKWR